MIEKYREYFNYYAELEKDFFSTEPYVTIEKDNFKTFSVQYNKIYQSIKCNMKRWYDNGCYTGFFGQNFFEMGKLHGIMK